jgi:glucosamine 6-phosphate synthetase-like amidotransferase/phosphosugar isomerase protein
MSVDEYLLNPRMEISKPEQDCFHKLNLYMKQHQNERSNFCILSTRYASAHGGILENQAHPCVYGDVGVFHNGFISNYKELQQEALGNTTEDLTDT